MILPKRYFILLMAPVHVVRQAGWANFSFIDKMYFAIIGTISHPEQDE